MKLGRPAVAIDIRIHATFVEVSAFSPPMKQDNFCSKRLPKTSLSPHFTMLFNTSSLNTQGYLLITNHVSAKTTLFVSIGVKSIIFPLPLFIAAF
jgi:hypothetical protein